MVGGSYHMPYPDVYLYDYDLHPLASLAAGLLGEKLGARGGGDAERGDLACRGVAGSETSLHRGEPRPELV